MKQREKKTQTVRENRRRMLNGPWVYAVLATSFILSRLAYRLAGVRFDSWDGSNPMQLIFPELMKTDLLRSLFYLHSQPPLFNLFVGLSVRIFPGGAVTFYTVVYLTLGMALVFGMFRLMTGLGVSRGVSLAVTIAVSASPAFILYENILLYTYPVAVLLCLAALALLFYAKTGSTCHGVVFFGLLAAIVLTRSLFHPLWFAAALVLVILFLKGMRLKTLAVAALPLVVILAVCGKNAYLFGRFSLSSWLGASVAKVTTFMLPEEERIGMAERGELSELALIPPIQGLWIYHGKARVPRFDKTGIPVLDLEYWPSVGNNYNNLSFQSLSDQYFRDAVTVMKKHPGIYLRGLARSFSIYGFPASDWFVSRTTANLDAVAPAGRVYDLLLYGRFAGNIPTERGVDVYGTHVHNARNMGFLIVIWYIVAVGYGLFCIIRGLRRTGSFAPETAAVAFMVMTIVYVTLAANMVEVLENMRFRFNTEPLAAVLIAMWAGEALRFVRRRTRV